MHLKSKINSKRTRASVKIITIAVQKCLKKVKKTFKYNRGKKSIKVPFVIYDDKESLIEKIKIHKKVAT